MVLHQILLVGWQMKLLQGRQESNTLKGRFDEKLEKSPHNVKNEDKYHLHDSPLQLHHLVPHLKVNICHRCPSSSPSPGLASRPSPSPRPVMLWFWTLTLLLLLPQQILVFCSKQSACQDVSKAAVLILQVATADISKAAPSCKLRATKRELLSQM